MRRLDRVGGSQRDVSALRQLLASFSSADRLPAAVTAGGAAADSAGGSDGGSGSSGAAAAAAADGAGGSNGSSGSRELADGSRAGSGGGSVRKGAMIVFERNTQGNVTARVSG